MVADAVNDGDDDDDDSDFDADAADGEDDADDDDDATFAELAGAEGSRGRVRAADPDRIRAADPDRRAKSTSTRAHAETSRERALELLAAAKSQWLLARGGFALEGDGATATDPRACVAGSDAAVRAVFREPSTVPSSVPTSGAPAGYVHVSARVYVARGARGGSLWRRAVENYEVRSEAYKAYLDAIGVQLGTRPRTRITRRSRDTRRVANSSKESSSSLARGTRRRRAGRRRW